MVYLLIGTATWALIGLALWGITVYDDPMRPTSRGEIAWYILLGPLGVVLILLMFLVDLWRLWQESAERRAH